MTTDVRITERGTRHAVEIGVKIPFWKIAKVYGDNFPRLGSHIESRGGTTDGAPYGRYLDMDWDCMRGGGFFKMIWQLLTEKLNLQIGMPVAEPVEGDGDIRAIEIPGGRYVEATHRGPYQKLGDTYKQIIAWADGQGIRVDDGSIENYVNDPTTVPKEQIETLIQIRVLT